MKSMTPEHGSLRWPAIAAAVVLAGLIVRLVALGTIPPGLFFDEAADAHDALRVWAGAHPIFFEGNLGREPLYIYALAPAIGLLGPGVVPIRLVSVAFGTILLVATYAFARQAFGERVAVVATFLAAFSYWQVHLSRIGFRAVAEPAIQTIGVYLIWLGIKKKRFWPYPLGGAFLGLSFYTYLASRFVTPILLGLLVLVIVFEGGWHRDLRRRLLAAVSVVGATIAVAAPLGYYMVRHPGLFGERIDTIDVVNPLSGLDKLALWIGNVGATYGIFFVQGDWNPRHDLPGRAAFDPLMSVFFVVGLPLLLRRTWRTAGVFVALWIALTLVPLTFTSEMPHFLRAVGVMPAIYLVPAVAVVSLWEWSVSRPRYRMLVPASLAVTLALSAVWTLYDYYVVWPNREDTFEMTSADARQAASLVLSLESGSVGIPPSRIYLASDIYDGQPQPFAALVGPHDAVHPFNGERAFVYPGASDGRVAYVIPESTVKEWPNLDRFLPSTAIHLRIPSPYGGDAVRSYSIESSELQPRPLRSLPARFGDAVDLIGYDDARAITPGQPNRFVIYWRIDQSRWYPWRWAMTMISADGQPVSETTLSDTLAADSWREGDVVASWSDVLPERNLKPGLYYVNLEMADSGKFDRVRIHDPNGRDVGTKLRLGPVRVVGTVTTGERSPIATFGDAIGLEKGSADVDRALAEGKLTVRLTWLSLSRIDVDYVAFVHVLDDDGNIVAQHDSQPRAGALPTSVWTKNETVSDSLDIDFPAEAPAGSGRVVVGLYDPATGKRLPVYSDGRQVGDAWTVGTISFER